MDTQKDKEEFKELAELFKQISDILYEAVDIQDKLDKGEIEMSEKEAQNKVDELLGKFIVKLLKAKKVRRLEK